MSFYSIKTSTFHIQLSLGLPPTSVHIVCSNVLCGCLIDDEPVLCPIFLKAILSISAQFHSILHPERDEERQRESETERDKDGNNVHKKLRKAIYAKIPEDKIRKSGTCTKRTWMEKNRMERCRAREKIVCPLIHQKITLKDTYDTVIILRGLILLELLSFL